MKKVIFLMFGFMLFVGCFAQNDLVYENVVIVDSTLFKDELFKRAEVWITRNFNSGESVIDYSDQESGHIIVKGKFQYITTVFASSQILNGNISFTLELFFKDGRYKYKFTDFSHRAYPTSESINIGNITADLECPYKIHMTGKGWRNKAWVDIKATINTNVYYLKNSLSEEIQQVPELDSNW